MPAEQKNKTLFVSSIVLVIIHVVGLIGIHSSYNSFFLSFTSVNLLVSFFLLLINMKNFTSSSIVFFAVTCLIGFGVEVFGVASGQLFGTYTYGPTLGPQIYDVPVIIGLNWFLLIYTVGCISNPIKINIFFKSMLGAGMLVVLDFFIEPIAIKYNFWRWTDGKVPLQNYIAWFIISFVLLLFFNKVLLNRNNPLARLFYLIELIFFILLSIL
jgi:putative membrane protein